MSAQPFPQRRSWIAALVAQVEEFVFETVEEPAMQSPPVEIEPHPVVAVVSAAPRSGSSTVARLLAAQLAAAGGSAGVLATATMRRRGAPASRAASRTAAALAGVAPAVACGRLCIASAPPSEARRLADAARYLAPVVFDVAPDGSAAGIAPLADRVVVVGGAASEPALVEAVAFALGGGCISVANRVRDAERWAGRVDLVLPDARLAARAAEVGACAVGPLGSAIAKLADALEARR